MPAQVSEQLRALIARTQADELIVTSQIYDHQARLRSCQIVAETLIGEGPTTNANQTYRRPSSAPGE